MLDTSILIDYYSRRKPFFDNAALLRSLEYFGDAELWISTNSFTDAFCILNNEEVDSLVLQKAMLESLSFFHVCSIAGNDLIHAFDKKWDDFEDALIATCSEKIKADFIITRDKKGFMKSKVPALNPEEFFERLKNEYGFVYEEVYS